MQEKQLKDYELILGDGNYSSKYPKSSEFLNEGIPFLSASDFKDKFIDYNNSKKISPELHKQLTKGHVQQGDILIVVRGNGVGKTGYINDKIDECNINAQLAFIRSNDPNLDNEFLYYNMTYNIEKLKGLATGSAQPQLVISNLIKYSFSAPDIKDQIKIRKILSSIDKKIEINEKINNILYKIGDSIYESEINKNEIEYTKLESIYNFQYGKGNNNPSNGGIFPVYGSNGIIGGYTEYNSEEAPVIGHIGANCGSLVFAYGKHYVTYNGIICNIKDENIRYLGYQVLRKLNFRNEIRGSSQPFISYDLLNNMSIPLISEKDKIKYEKIYSSIFKTIGSNISENEYLERLKRSLMPKLMNGEINMNDIII